MFHAILIWVLLTMSYGNFGLQAALADHFAEYEEQVPPSMPCNASAVQIWHSSLIDKADWSWYMWLKHYHSSWS